MRKNSQWNVKRSWERITGAFTLCLLLACFLTGCGGLKQTPALTGSAQDGTETSVPETTVAELSVTDLLKAVVALKDDLETAMDDIKEDDLVSAGTKIDGLSQKTETIRSSLNATIDNLGDSMPSMTDQLNDIQDLLDLVDLASEKVLKPLVNQLQNHPFTGMQSGDGISTGLICEYLDFAESLMPGIEALVEKANTTDLSPVDSEGKIAKRLETANEMLEMYRTDSTVFSRLKSIFGADGDRVYVVAAQNSAEIRASGGFPGAVGTIRIKDDVLILEDFRKVYNVFSSYTPAQANITNTENRLFHGGLSAPRDADYCPDFERVAYISALGYEADAVYQIGAAVAANAGPKVVGVAFTRKKD